MTMSTLSQVNWIAVLLATAPTMLLGFVYFGVFFGKTYATILGRSFDPKTKPEPIFIIGPLLCTVVTNITNAFIMKSIGISTVTDALCFGAVVGIGYLTATMTNVAINPNMPRPLSYALLNAPYFLGINILACGILGAL